jgi:hypothetical protein
MPKQATSSCLVGLLCLSARCNTYTGSVCAVLGTGVLLFAYGTCHYVLSHEGPCLKRAVLLYPADWPCRPYGLYC